MPSGNKRIYICGLGASVEYSLYSLVSNTCSETTNIDSFISRWMCFGWRGKIRIRVVGLNYTGDVGASVYFSNLTNQTFRARIYLKELDKAVCKISKLLYNK